MAGTSINPASGIVLEPLTKVNYKNWSSLVKNYLIGQGLWSVVKYSPETYYGVKPKSVSGFWKTKNAKALHIIQLACGSENLTQIRKLQTAKDAWNKLSALYTSKLEGDADIEQGVVDDSLLDNKPLHMYVESGDWNDAKAFINTDRTRTAIYSTSLMGRTILHVAVIAGHEHIVKNLVNEHIVKNLVKEGGRADRDKLVKMQDKDGYTALALAAELTGNTKIAECLVGNSNKVGRDLLTMETKDGNKIPLLLAAAKGHKEMTAYLYKKTLHFHPDLFIINQNSYDYGVSLLTKCINAEIFDVALDIVRNPKLPLAHESDDRQGPLYALAKMPSAFPSGSKFGFLKQLIYYCLRIDIEEMKLGDSINTRVVPNDVLREGRSKISIAGKLFGQVLNFPPVKIFVRVLICALLLFQNSILLKFWGKLFGHVLNFPPVKIFVRVLISALLLFQNSILLKCWGMKEIYDEKMKHKQVAEILKCLCDKISKYKDSDLRGAYDAMLQAAKHGTVELIDALRKANPDLLWAVDKNKRGIFSYAIIHRRLNVFKLINDVNGRKEIIKCRTDAFGNNLLHLAAQLGPPSDLDRRPGAALQMQREIQWFKEVEKIVHPQCKEAKNIDRKKPRHIFTESHEEMVKLGERWAKDTAKSFTLVGTLITTIMFAAAFTVPGGNNQTTGVPIFVHDQVFTLFIVADTISLFTSSTAVLVFIGILTSRYAEKDFLIKLPLKLLFGLVLLFLSVVHMMAAFCASIAMILKGYNQQVIIAAMSLASIPVIVHVPTQLSLFREILYSTMGLG